MALSRGGKRSVYPILFVAAALSAACYQAYGPLPPMVGGGEMAAVADNLVRHGAFANPFAVAPTGPTAVVPPLYPLALALLLKLFGQAAGWAALLLNLECYGVFVCLLAKAGEILLGDLRAGLWAAGVAIALPVLRINASWDVVITATTLLGVLIAAERTGGSPGKVWLAGMAGGILLLLNPATALILGPFVLYRWRRPMRPAILFLAAAAVTVTPWMTRNLIKLGAFTLKDNLGMTLYSSDNDCAQPGITATLATGCYQAHHPEWSPAEAALLVRLGEPAYDKLRIRSAMAWMRANPGRFLRLTARRALEFWFPGPTYGLYAYTVWFTTTAGFAGIGLMLRRRMTIAWPMLAVFLIYPWLYYVVVSDIRYRYPIHWISLLAVGFVLQMGAEQVRRPWLRFGARVAAFASFPFGAPKNWRVRAGERP